MNNMNWQTTGQLAGLLGAIKIAHLGTQNHKFDLTEIERLYQHFVKTLILGIVAQNKDSP
jgi:hypothetical protein